MLNPIKILSIVFVLSHLTACVVFPLQENANEQALNGCPPLPNCVSTETSTFMHRIEDFRLDMPMPKAWPLVRQAVAELPRVTIYKEYPGYIYAKSHSKVFNFVDYFEVLSAPQRLMVRSSSLLGISDLGVNKKRTESLRQKLQIQGVIK